ncbi:cell division protein ZapE [Deinococcus psychrotolerans]|uniref:Cell division protein ZapE n=1 Tax=Deinococcus psychrotolerans TaxID=2489213 RepID=A0A3G8YAX8_9DEIO|nr:cell division protein ZapE [Deinococcus psychrotolerans]AZI41357.1 cell division protein ZapE [Deinococcus psychrotolerans]
MLDLTARRPSLTPQQLSEGLAPSARFEGVRFENYQPNSAFASQARARDALAVFAAEAKQKPSGFRLFKRHKPEGRGLYLDGGFGVGKTHLLASTYHAASGKRALMSFQELMYLIGALGMTRAVETFKDHDLLLIDEFELDDPGNTHMANTFLGQLMPQGVSVVATSNTEPGALGQGRFNARDFERQIKGIASRFENLGLDGPDFRQRGAAPAQVMSDAEFGAWAQRQDQATLAVLLHRDLSHLLLEVHPSRFAKLLSGVSAVGVRGLVPMPDQNVALRFVHFVDKLYDLGLSAAFTGVSLNQLFDSNYRHGGYAKKYSRALSRLSELLTESAAQSETSA